MPDSLLPPHANAGHAAGPAAHPRETPADWPGQFVPNLEQWRVGDIVLVERDATAIGRLLQIGQAFTLNPLMAKGSRWSHAALYAGHGEVIEANYGVGVVRRSLWNHCQTRALRVRRLPPPYVSAASAAASLRFAERLVGRRYSLKALLRSKFIPRTRPDVEELYCSTFVALVIARATAVQLWDGPDRSPIYPAVLASHPELDDVSLCWRHL